jgi:hypothetical protein
MLLMCSKNREGRLHYHRRPASRLYPALGEQNIRTGTQKFAPVLARF